ncbi:outer membrane beta-barrel protein [Myxococcus fulvus]|uniref:outer membrane beta-barrel protein n=1 Tax=Myxococcus fulvus TaxID=33 RepID=UPI003B9C5AE9
MLRRLLPPLVLLFATPAVAQDEEDPIPASLDGVGRITVQGGWRVTSNETLYKTWYAVEANKGLSRARETDGGPLGVATFAYSISDLVEVGIDLFFTGSKLYLTSPGLEGGAPLERSLETLGYGALVGVRFQTVLPEVGPYGLVPFAGLATGPAIASSKLSGEKLEDKTTQAWAGSLGATWRLSPRWGLSAEYRFMFLRGPVGPALDDKGKRIASFSLGGSWMSLGVTYTFPPEPSRPLSGGL